MQLLGYSSAKKTVKDLFGSVENFIAEVQRRNKNNFVFEKRIIVIFDKEEDRFEFYSK